MTHAVQSGPLWVRRKRTLQTGLALLPILLVGLMPQSQAADDFDRQRQLTIQHRRDRILLNRAANALQSGQTSTAVSYLQRVFDQPADSFIETDPNGQLTSVRFEAAQLLESAEPAVLRIYEQQSGGEARFLLNQARQSRDPERFQEISRRFFYTDAGFTAADWLATHWLNAGRFALAARQWNRLLTSSAHRSRITPVLRLKAALAHQLSGDQERSMQLLNQVNANSITIAGQPTRPETWLAEVPELGIQASLDADQWLLPLGNLRNNRAVDGSPCLLHPLWRVDQTRDADTTTLQHIERWEQNQINRYNPIAVANTALVVHDKVVIRDFQGIRAFNLHSGEPHWNYRCESSLAQAVENIRNGAALRRNRRAAGRQVGVDDVFVDNSVLGTLSSDGERIYLVDSVDLTRGRSPFPPNGNRAGMDDQAGRTLTSNRLIALPVDPDASRDIAPVWSVGGAAGEQSTGRDLADHYFLGPPLPADGRLFAVTESQRQLNLVALEPETGNLLWSQGISFVATPMESDPVRWKLSCSPVFADGVVVCPTQMGKLVAVDALTGSLLWEREYPRADHQLSRPRRRFLAHSVRPQGHLGFINLPHIHGRYIVYLPMQSEHVYGFDLYTGEALWDRAPARDDGEYVAAITDQTILLVGRRFCRGLSLQSGHQQWETQLGLPSGRGVQLGSRYLLPLEEGRIATIDLTTGREVGMALDPQVFADESANRGRNPSGNRSAGNVAPWHPGNLIASGDVIISVGWRDLTVLPQAAPLLARVRKQLENNPDSPRQQLLAAELELTLDNRREARSLLTDLVTPHAPAGEHSRAEDLLREMLYDDLETGQGDPAKLLEQLKQLSRTPEHQGRYLAYLGRQQMQQEDWRGLLQSAEELVALNLETPLPLKGNRNYLIAPTTWAREILMTASEHLTSKQQVEMQRQIVTRQQAALESEEIGSLRQFLTLYGRWPQAEPVRTRLAKHLIGRGHFQEAELLLLENRGSSDPQTAAAATRLLLEFWDQQGLYTEAARLLAELNGRFADVPLPDGTRGRDYVSEFDRHRLTWSAFLRTKPLPWSVSRVRIANPFANSHNLAISNTTDDTPSLDRVYRGYRRYIRTPREFSWHLLEKGSAGKISNIVMIHKDTGTIAGRIKIPAQNQHLSWLPVDPVGHFLPLGSRGTMHGLSLLEHKAEKPLWNQVPWQRSNRNGTVRTGPAGPDFCIYQTPQHLIAVHPADGRILWQRSDLAHNGGLMNDSAGLIGDKHVLVLFDNNRQAHTVYRTRTGEELYRGRLDIDIRYARRALGRKLCYMSESDGGLRLKIWDPLHNRIEREFPALSRTSFYVMPSNELVIVQPDGRLRIVDVEHNAIIATVQLPRNELANFNALRAFRDRDRYYINVQHAGSFRRNMASANDAFLPGQDVHGTLFAIHRESGRLQWTRKISLRTMLQLPEYRLPFLVGLSRLRDRTRHNNQSMITEIIDKRTGETIELKESLFPDQIVRLFYNFQQGQLTLQGRETQIEMEFGPEHQWAPQDETPL